MALGGLVAVAAGAMAAAQTAPAVPSSPAPDPVPPAIAVQGGAVVLTPQNTAAVGPGNRLLARIAFPPVIAAPVLGPDKTGPGHQLLRRLVASGQAAGNAGDLYENRDRDHSRLPPAAFPQLTRVLYGPALRQRGLDYGLAGVMLFDAPLIGNSSTAVAGGLLWRSLPRLALTSKGGAAALYQDYLAGQIHVYPEHRDHDPDHGDLLPANTPYMLISQGSSGSDQPHLEALAMILAAFRPDTKERLRQTGLIAPTVQMVYRRARVGVRSRAAYLSGAAHPSVFRDRDIDLVRMVGLANAIRPDEIPPMVRLAVLEETAAVEGVDYFGEGQDERLFDTPSAIARVWRSRAGRRSLVVSAADTTDPNGRPLRFDWVLLRGDPDRVRITPLTPEGRYALIEMDWQSPRPAPGAPDILSPRIDIGVFADNGAVLSAPAFVSVLLPAHEARDYDTGPDGVPRVRRIDRRVPAGGYADPLVFPVADWVDIYDPYDPAAGDGPAGWTRMRAGGTTRHDAQGRRLDPEGAPPVALRYPVVRGKDGIPHVSEVAADPAAQP